MGESVCSLSWHPMFGIVESIGAQSPDVVIAELPRLSEGHDDVQLDQIDQLVI
jgi:hypothetical protein